MIHLRITELSLFLLDDKFLLQFLRTKKYDFEKATELFETYMLLKFTIPKWCDWNENAVTRMWKLYETGVAYPLLERDSEGRRVIFVQTRKMDPKQFTLADAIHLVVWIAKAILEEEETQISGIVTVVDQTDLTFGHIRLFSVRDVMDFVSMIKNGAVGRQKGMYMVKLPSFASFMVEVAKKAMTEKLRKRIHLIDSMETMQGIFTPNIFPLENGGTVPEAEMMRSFKKTCDDIDADLKSIQEGVDWDRVALEGESSCSLM